MRKVISKLVILLLVFVAVAAAVLFMTRKKEPEAVYTVMENATLPVISMEYQGSPVNLLHGYTQEMDLTAMRDTITPVGADRMVPFSVKTYGNTIESVSYEVRSLDGETLMESGRVEALSGDSSTRKGSITLQDILDRRTEYVLVFAVKTPGKDPASYYTRIRFDADTHIADQIAFVQHFSELAFSKNTSDEMTVQLESTYESDTSSLGYVDITSSYQHVSWGKLSPKRSGEIYVNIKEMNQSVGSVELDYTVTAEGDTGKIETYHVREFMSVRYVDGKLWLIAYERTMDQAFEASEAVAGAGTIDLGIISPEGLPIELRSAGDYTAFVADGELWSYNKAENEALRLFSFKEKNDDGIRTLYDQHKFRILNVSDTGDVSFTVYGYMNRGSHEGQCGLVFYKYDRETNSIREVFFIRSRRPYQIMKEEIGTLSYVGNQDLFYLMSGSSIYAIDFTGEESVEILSGMEKETLVVSDDSSAIAWQEEPDLYGGKTIHVFYMDDGTTFTIHADAGECIRALGFIDGDFVYGKARENDITRSSLVVNDPMYAMDIISKDQTLQEHYAPDGCYIKEIRIEDGKIQINRESRSADGSWSAASDDALILSKTVEEEKSVVVSRWSDLKKTTYSLELASEQDSSKVLSIATPKELVGDASHELTLASSARKEDQGKQYYSYGCGRLMGISYELEDAIGLVYGKMGVVVDETQNYIWTRANRKTESLIEFAQNEIAESEADSLRACLAMMLQQFGSPMDAGEQLQAGKTAYEILGEAFGGKAVDLHGCILNEILYYVDLGRPVLAMTEGNKTEMIIGYDVFKNLIIYNPMDGSTYKVSEEDAEAYYAEYAYPFVSWIP